VDAAGLATWTRMLARGASRQNVVQAIENTGDYRTALVQSLYQTFLHRPADPAGLAAGIKYLATGHTDEQAAALLLGSGEYFQKRGGGTVTGFLTALYRDVFGRLIDPASQAFFSNELAHGTARTAVAYQVLTSVQAEQTLVQSLYRKYLGKSGDAASVSTFVQRLQQGGRDEEIIANLLGTTTYSAGL
jgi:hypothetical protein